MSQHSIEMYVTNGDSLKCTADTSEIENILAIYFADNELSIDEDKLILTLDLIRFFSVSPGLDLALQVNKSSIANFL